MMRDGGEKRAAIAERAREARRLSGLSQAQVAKLMGWHRPTVSQIEAGERNVTGAEAAELSRIYDVDLGWLLAEEPDSLELTDARVFLAARELEKLKPEDLERLMRVLAAMRKEGSDI